MHQALTQQEPVGKSLAHDPVPHALHHTHHLCHALRHEYALRHAQPKPHTEPHQLGDSIAIQDALHHPDTKRHIEPEQVSHSIDLSYAFLDPFPASLAESFQISFAKSIKEGLPSRPLLLIPLSAFVKRRGSASKEHATTFHGDSRPWPYHFMLDSADDYWGQAGPELPSIAACALSPRSLPVTTDYEWRRKTKWDCGLPHLWLWPPTVAWQSGQTPSCMAPPHSPMK